MKKNLLTVAMLVTSTVAFSQILTHVDDNAAFYVGESTLVYNGGGMQTKGTGIVDIHGNVMVVGTAGTDKFRTLDANGVALTTPGSNIILRLDDQTPAATKYGQLYITGLSQADITGFVSKEFMATKNGSMQQMALPFYNKSLASVASDLGLTGFSNLRNNNAVGYWDNAYAVMHNLPAAATTQDKAAKDPNTVLYNNALRYYSVGAASWSPEALHTIKGVPFSDNSASGNLIATLYGAGYAGGNTPIDYGVGTGNRINMYNERYNSYLQDAMAQSTEGYFNGSFGRSNYQFSNPFFTNLLISGIVDQLGSANVYGIRYESSGVTTNSTSGTKATSIKYITYAGGTPAGDTETAIIKPMGAFVIKMNDNVSRTLDFNILRRFSAVANTTSLTASAKMAPTSVANMRMAASAKTAGSSSTLKQLRVIGFDANGSEVARTYYVVGKNLKTGTGTNYIQASAFTGALSTREEMADGTVDPVAKDKYWLYINGANEVDYKGKPISMVTDTSKITSYRFEIAENAVAIADQQSTLSSGEKFYIEQNGIITPLSNNMSLSASTANANLYYGTSNSGTLATTENTVEKTNTIVAYDDFENNYKVVFAPHWKKADVYVYDGSGRLVTFGKQISADTNYTITTTGFAQGVYVVKAVSENNEVATQKIIIK